MADTIRAASWTSPPTAEKVEQSSRKPFWQYLALGAIILISLFMNFYQLGQTGYGNEFYVASVRSMLDSWHNFFFVSFDPGGFVTVDKPPLGYWLQTISAKLFGLTAFSVFFPQALAGVLSVLVIYKLVKDRFGVVAGLLSGLVLALSPISIITDRSNQVDSMLALVMILGAWAVLKAAKTGKLRWLLLCAVILGLGYNVKMLEAYLVIPAFGLLYLVGAPRTIWTRIWHLALAIAMLLVISLSWSVVVDMIPASQRPFVDSTQDNSEIGLAIGWNGASRILGMGAGGPGGGQRGNPPNGDKTRSANGTGNAGQPPFAQDGNRAAGQQRGPGQGGPGGGGPGGGGGFFGTGNPGPLRLFIGSLAGQTAWFLPLALLGILAVAWKRRPRLQSDVQQQSVLMWGMWLITMVAFFSIAGFFHQYYLTVMAPSIAALSGIGIVSIWQDYRSPGWRGWLLPVAIALTATEQIYILTGYPAYGKWLIPTIAVLAALSVVVLIVARTIPRLRLSIKSVRYLVPALSFGMLALLLTPAVWSYTELSRSSGGIPSAGPDQGGGPGGGGPGNSVPNQANRNAAQRVQSNSDNGGAPGGGGVNTKLVSYLEANQGNTKYLFAVTNSNSAAPYIIATNKPVMSLGGFSGSDPILNTTSLSKLVSNGTIRFFLLNGRAQTSNQQAAGQNAPGGGPGGGQNSVTTWVQNHCTTVPSSEWQNSTSNAGGGFGGFGGGPGGGGNEQLYDCANAK